ncbi:MAG: hypothetical protein ACE5IW_09860 [bacterium]
MKLCRWHLTNLIVFISLVVIHGCTENPIGEVEVSAENREIRGKVQLGNNMSPASVYVWLEGFDIGTRTDEQGNFQITLPLPSSQGNPAGVTGAFNIYYFVANFNLDSTQVFTRNGFFVYSQGEVDGNGELNNPKTLFQNLRITTHVRPSSVSAADFESAADAAFILRVDVTLEATTDTVVVFFPALVNDTFGPLIFRNITTDDVVILQSAIAGLVESDLDTIDSVPVMRTMAIKMTLEDLPKGEYEVIPYLLIKNEDVPRLLIESLGENVEALGQGYLAMPFRREGNRRFFRVN